MALDSLLVKERPAVEQVHQSRSNDYLLGARFFQRSVIFFGCGALVWSLLCVWYQLWFALLVPASFLVASIVTLTCGVQSDGFRRCRRVMVPLMILMPFAFQVAIGGMQASGNVMIWSLLALGCVITFEPRAVAMRWSIAVVVLSALFMAIDPALPDPGLKHVQMPDRLFLLINIAAVGLAIVVLAQIFVRMQNATRRELQGINHRLALVLKELEGRTTDILDGMKYARNIQAATFPDLMDHNDIVSDHFVLHKPKDHVGGDFFWSTERDGLFFVVVADCTGHGTAGALLSMMCIQLLDSIVLAQRYYDPGQIVEQLHTRLSRALLRAGESQSDGADIAVIVIDRPLRMIRYAGTGIDLLSFDGYSMQLYKADRAVVNMDHLQQTLQPKVHSIMYEPGFRIYCCTDGLLHQFGKDGRSKFKMQGLQQCLRDTAERPIAAQGAALRSVLESWQGKERQVDDILALGLKLV